MGKSPGNGSKMPTRYRLFSNKEALKTAWLEQRKRLKPKLLLQNPYFIGALFVFSLIPFLFGVMLIRDRFGKLSENQKHFKQIEWRAKRLVQTHKSRNKFLEKYKQVDPYYLNHATESLVFLKPEIDALKVIYGHPTFQSCPAVKTRLTALTKGDNRIVFLEKGREVSKLIEEMRYTQAKPVEVNGEDIKNILSIIEGVSIDPYEPPPFRPQLVIKRFDLKRESLLGRESYFLEMDLIKREPL